MSTTLSEMNSAFEGRLGRYLTDGIIWLLVKFLCTQFWPLRRQVNNFLIRDVVLVHDGILVGGPRVLQSPIDLVIVVVVMMVVIVTMVVVIVTMVVVIMVVVIMVVVTMVVAIMVVVIMATMAVDASCKNPRPIEIKTMERQIHHLNTRYRLA